MNTFNEALKLKAVQTDEIGIFVSERNVVLLND